MSQHLYSHVCRLWGTYKICGTCYKTIYGLSSPPLGQFVNIRTTSSQHISGAIRGDNTVPLRKSTFSQLSVSVKAAQEWCSSLCPSECPRTGLI